nr:hypothetical protein [Tanacetum cinerariifolium]
MVIEMADRSMQSPKVIVENVLVKINKFTFPVDFIILDIVEDDKVPIIIGRPMLATAHTRIDVFGSARLNDDSSEMYSNPNSNSSINMDDFVEMDDVWNNLDFRDLTNEATKFPTKPNKNGLSVVPGIANQHGNGNVVAAWAEGIILNSEEFNFMAAASAYDEIEKVTANCNLQDNLQQASTSDTHSDKAPAYDSAVY